MTARQYRIKKQRISATMGQHNNVRIRKKLSAEIFGGQLDLYISVVFLNCLLSGVFKTACIFTELPLPRGALPFGFHGRLIK